MQLKLSSPSQFHVPKLVMFILGYHWSWKSVWRMWLLVRKIWLSFKLVSSVSRYFRTWSHNFKCYNVSILRLEAFSYEKISNNLNRCFQRIFGHYGNVIWQTELCFSLRVFVLKLLSRSFISNLIFMKFFYILRIIWKTFWKLKICLLS